MIPGEPLPRRASIRWACALTCRVKVMRGDEKSLGANRPHERDTEMVGPGNGHHDGLDHLRAYSVV